MNDPKKSIFSTKRILVQTHFLGVYAECSIDVGPLPLP